jgi:hypothetical protein
MKRTHPFGRAGALALAIVLAAGLPASTTAQDRSWADAARETPRRVRHGVAGLPDARGRSFTTLDAYLAHLRRYAATVDRPWYREVRPGVFRLETGTLRSGAPPHLQTRAELERRFGFVR